MPTQKPKSILRLCGSCGPISGGFRTVQQFSRSYCEETIGLGFIPTASQAEYAKDPNTLGDCGDAWIAPDCDAYYAFRSFNGIPVSVNIPWTALSTGPGSILVDACNVTNASDIYGKIYPDAIPVYYDPNDKEVAKKSCEEFGKIHPELNLCITSQRYWDPITITNTNTTITDGEINESGSPWGIIGGIGAGFSAVVIGATLLAKWFSDGDGGSGGGGSSLNYPVTPGEPIGSPASLIADKILKPYDTSKVQSILETAGYVVGGVAVAGIVIVGTVAAAPYIAAGAAAIGLTGGGAGLALGGTGSFLVIIYNTDGTSNVLIMQPPPNGT